MTGQLTLSRDRKVSPLGSWESKRNRWVPLVRNSLGLLAGDSCPGKTEFCQSCYGVSSEQSAGVRDAMKRNLDLLLEAERIGGMKRMAFLLDDAIRRFKHQARYHRLNASERIFRIHWDGDFFSEDYACAWGLTIQRHPGVRFWAYTRSFTTEVDVVPILAGLTNLELYLSIDKYNAERAKVVMTEWPYVHAALCADIEDNARDLLPGRRSVACPENIGRVGLMTDGVGACVTCRLCPEGIADIRFLTSHAKVTHLPQRTGVVLGERICASPECTNRVPAAAGRGAPLKFCCTRCRLRAAYLRRQSA